MSRPILLTVAGGLALMLCGWRLSAGTAGAVLAVLGVIALAGVAFSGIAHTASTAVALLFVAQVATAADPPWWAVVLGTGLLAVFLALTELCDAAAPPVTRSLRTHALPCAAAIAAALLASGCLAAVGGRSWAVAAGIAAAAGVLLLLQPLLF